MTEKALKQKLKQIYPHQNVKIVESAGETAIHIGGQVITVYGIKTSIGGGYALVRDHPLNNWEWSIDNINNINAVKVIIQFAQTPFKKRWNTKQLNNIMIKNHQEIQFENIIKNVRKAFSFGTQLKLYDWYIVNRHKLKKIRKRLN